MNDWEVIQKHSLTNLRHWSGYASYVEYWGQDNLASEIDKKLVRASEYDADSSIANKARLAMPSEPQPVNTRIFQPQSVSTKEKI